MASGTSRTESLAKQTRLVVAIAIGCLGFVVSVRCDDSAQNPAEQKKERPASIEELTAEYNRLAFGHVPKHQRPPLTGAPFPKADQKISKEKTADVPECIKEARKQYQHFLKSSGKWREVWPWAACIGDWSASNSLVATAPGSVLAPFNLSASLRLNTWLSRDDRYLRAVDFGPPACPILMVRNARRAVAEKPDSLRSWQTLEEAIYNLSQNQEQYWTGWTPAGRLNLRGMLRSIQEMSAVQSVLALSPSSYKAHSVFGDLCLNLHFLDLALEHYRQALQHLEAIDVKGKDKAAVAEFDARVRLLRDKFRRLERDVELRRGEFDLTVGDLGSFDRYKIAVRQPFKTFDKENKDVVDARGMGLVLLGLQQLAEVKPERLTREEMLEVTRAQIHLLLMMGRAADVAEILNDNKVRAMVGQEYHKYRLFFAAAKGDYLEMEKSLIELEKEVDLERVQKLSAEILGTRIQLTRLPELPLVARTAQFNPAFSMVLGSWTDRCNYFLEAAADLRLLRGVLALEAGDTAIARDLLEESMKLGATQSYWSDRPIAVRYLTFLREQEPK